jgi:L-lactate utilization protein LutB
MQNTVKNTILNLEKNGFTVRYFEKTDEAVNSLVSDIRPEESVGFGGSMTVSDLGIYEKLMEQGNQLFWHWKSLPGVVKSVVISNAATADIYITGTNAITEDGRLVNIDGIGNRLSSMLYGHNRVYIVSGVNKIAGNIDEAIIRIKNIASPKNAERLNLDTPCRHLGKCMNCDSPQRICSATLILDRQPRSLKIIIYLIDESLGY